MFDRMLALFHALPGPIRVAIKWYLLIMVGFAIAGLLYLVDGRRSLYALHALQDYQPQIAARQKLEAEDDHLIFNCIAIKGRASKWEGEAAQCLTSAVDKVKTPFGKMLVAIYMGAGDSTMKKQQLPLLKEARNAMQEELQLPWIRLHNEALEGCQQMIFPCPAATLRALDYDSILRMADKEIQRAQATELVD